MSALTRAIARGCAGAASLILAATLACAPAREAGRDAGTPAAGAADSADDSAATTASLYELDFQMTDADGRERRLSEFRGHPIVASMIYTHCTSTCPRVTAELQALDRALPRELRERTRFVLFSLDPERDTPAALTAFARERALDPARWTLLAARPDDMRTLAAVLGVRFRPDAGGEIAHSALIVVVDGAGVIRHRRIGLGNDTASLVAAVRAVE